LLINIERLKTCCEDFCDHRVAFNNNLLSVVAQKGVRLMDKIETLSHRTTRDKLWSYFKQHAQGSTSFTIPYNREELAHFLGVDRSALSAELSRMRKEGLIDYHRNSFVLKKDMPQ
jgi:CRP-like cAMP-binding protein